jgi:hypothetical protein
MARKPRDCPDCGERLTAGQIYAVENFGGTQLCDRCRAGYDQCSRCGNLRLLRDMRGAWCKTCRSAYDRERFANQRAARGVP